ncbi:calponin homology domain-containing protein DDB_G0272472 [Perca fluviatilis]|uniref:calponin homology domain-containing protein DDB_G0272472 n=1 Tax=Perca fluviatilis TaxID=8168 RepID=UPI00196357FC|nr:calponin homology domain-containing protein DDB_G0272472 [Perca fluviatilis]XP_039658860.1 calponin homology domain-containing protein DDB_G0272472 [Perca fluviatilis]
MSLIEIPSINQSHILSPEPNKPVPGPKPRLTPKPFSVERNPTIKPILAPKPQTKPRPESTRLPGCKPELPFSPVSPEPVATGKVSTASINPNRPCPTFFKSPNKLNTGQTTKPVVQPFKPAPPLDPGDPSKPTPPVTAVRKKPGSSNLAYSKSLKQLPAAEWSGNTKTKDETKPMRSSKGGASITRAKSMGFLNLVGQEEEEEEKEKANPAAAVVLRPRPRGSRPRPVSAIFLDSPPKTETPVPAPRSARRPLSADLTAKFESIGLSLHRPSPKANTKENTPEEKALPQKREQEKTPKSPTPQSTDGVAQPAVSDQSNKKAEEKTLKETDDEEKRAVSIKSRISLLLDSSSSPGTGVTGQGSDLHSPVQPVPETEPQVGVKQLIKQLIEDTTPTQSPVVKLPLKPRPLPLDLTKRFSTERSPDLGSVSLSEATDRHEISKDPQRRIEESAITPSDQRTFVDLKDSQEPLKKASASEGPEAGQTFGAAFKESSPSSDLQTVRASLFENVVERHSVLMVEEGQPANTANDSLSSPSFKRGNGEDDGTLVTATYREPVSPSCPLQVFHAFDTVQAVEENRAVSENIPSAQWEDKAMTLRSRRSEGSRPVTERTGSAPCEPALAATPEPQPRYLRVGALPKWTTASLKREESVEKGTLKGSQREGQVALDQDRDRQREAEQEEVAAAPKRLKMLQTEEQPKPRATYFALTGQIQEPVSPLAAGGNIGGDMAGPFGDFSATLAAVSSQGKILPMRRNPSLDKAFGKNSQDEVEELSMMRSHREVRSASDGQTAEELMEVEKKRELKKETERHMARMKEFEREKQRQLEMEKEAHLEFARMKERELQREFERQRQKAFEKEKQDFEEKRALERQKQLELEQKQQLQELERARLRELEKERQRHLEKEKRRELERQRREKLREQEKERQREQERQRQREEERQSELDKERRLLEIQKEKQKMEELERIKELETLQLLEFQKQKQKEKERQQLVELEKQRLKEKKEREEADRLKQIALEQEMLRMKELEKERERQREMEKEHQKEIEREKQRELERQRHRDIERERQRQRQLDFERQELENQRLRRELEKERQRKEEMERIKEVERRQFLELEKQKQAERDRLQMLELEKRRLRERMEREEADQMRQIAKQQEAERQRLKEREERQKKEEQERARLETSPLRPKVLDLDSVLRNEPLSRAASQRSDPATRWKEPSPRAEEVYKPAILDIDSFTSQAQLSPSKDLFPVSGIQGVDTGFGARLQPAPDVDVSWRVPPQASVGFTSPGWTMSPQDPWELRPVEMSVDKPAAEPRKHGNKLSPEQLLLRQEDRLLAPQRHWSAVPDEPLHLAPLPGTEAKSGGSPGGVSSSAPAEHIWLPREPLPQESSRGEVRIPRRSQGSQELSRMRSRSVSRRSAPLSSAVEGSLSRIRRASRPPRKQDINRWEQQKQSVGGEEELQESGTPVRDTDSQYGTWETGLRTDDSLTPATPTSESNLSPSPRKPTPPHTPGDRASQFDTDALDSLPPSSSAESQRLPFPEAPTTLLDTSALRSRAHLVKKRAPRTRPTRAARQTAALSEGEGGTTEDWLYRDSTEAKAESKDDDSESEERARGADASPAVSSQPQRVAMFPGMDPSALKAQLKKRSDSDNQIDGPTPSPSQLSRSPKSPFLPRAARVLPPPGGKENGEEDSPQWLKELKSKKRLSQYENDG